MSKGWGGISSPLAVLLFIGIKNIVNSFGITPGQFRCITSFESIRTQSTITHLPACKEICSSYAVYSVLLNFLQPFAMLTHFSKTEGQGSLRWFIAVWTEVMASLETHFLPSLAGSQLSLVLSFMQWSTMWKSWPKDLPNISGAACHHLTHPLIPSQIPSQMEPWKFWSKDYTDICPVDLHEDIAQVCALVSSWQQQHAYTRMSPHTRALE